MGKTADEIRAENEALCEFYRRTMPPERFAEWYRKRLPDLEAEYEWSAPENESPPLRKIEFKETGQNNQNLAKVSEYTKRGTSTNCEILRNRTAMGTSTTYGWDALNRMTSYTAGGASNSYVYRADGMRVSKSVGSTSTTTTYAYDSTGNSIGLAEEVEKARFIVQAGITLMGTPAADPSIAGQAEREAEALTLAFTIGAWIILGDIDN